MVKLLNQKLMILIVISLVFIDSYSQTDLVKEKKGWGIVAQSVIFQKAKTKVAFGSIKYNTINNYSMIYGIVFDIFQKKTIGIKTGVLFGTTPVINGWFLLKNEDIYYDEDYYFNELKLTSFLVTYLPLKLSYKIPLKKSTLGFEFGPQLQFTSESDISEGLVLINEDSGEAVEVYASYIEGHNKLFLDIQSSIGLYYKVGNFIINTSLIYNYGIKEKFKGEYQFGNLLVSKPTRGSLSISGNYIGLSLSIYLSKKKIQNGKKYSK